MHYLASIYLLLALALTACQSAEPPALDPENPTLAAVVAESEHYPGLIDSYQDKKSGDLYLLLRPEHLSRDYLYFATYLDGNGETGTQRGIHASQRVIRLQRDFDQVRFLQINTRFYFDPETALSRAADANLPPAVLAVAPVVDEGDAGEILVKANDVFLTEALQQIKPAADPEADPASTFTLGELSADRSTLETIRAYPRNLDLIVNYVYENPAPLVSGPQSLADSRFVSIRMQHSLVEAPDGTFAPRYEDPRVGYFTEKSTDMTDPGPAPFRDPIIRWKLKKKTPGAALSEPVEPIVFWLENTTPVAFRDTVKDAVLVWNQAFETAGFRNAIEVKIQPDDAEWDAGDLRYNVLRWTSSPESGWGGYGPSVTDPRTGEILGADIMLEFGWISTFLQRDGVFSEAMLPGRRRVGADGRRCAAGNFKKDQLMLGRALLRSRGDSAAESELVRQSIYDLVTHEVGHTLGLNHNFRASQLQSTASLTNHHRLDPLAVTASVMDYPAANYPSEPVDRPRYFLLGPGPYDHWAIEYGYSEALADPDAEKARLEAILSRSTEHALGFGLDADVMAGSTSGIDPRVMMFDLGSDSLTYAEARLSLVENAAWNLLERYRSDGETWQAFYNAWLSLTGEQARQLIVASRWIGGVYVDRSVQGQPGADRPLRPVEREKQKQAMALLREALFSPEALAFDDDIYRHLQQQRRGNEHWHEPQDPKLHARTLAVQQRVLDHLLHPVTMARINDSVLYGNAYPLAEMVSDLSDAVYAADLSTRVNTRRQQLQREYLERLLQIADPAAGSEHDHVSRGIAVYNIKQIEARIREQVGQPEDRDLSTRAHYIALLHRIETGLYPGRPGK